MPKLVHRKDNKSTIRYCDQFFCDCCQNYFYVDASPDFHCLISDDYIAKLLAIYCDHCTPSRMMSQPCSYCQWLNEAQNEGGETEDKPVDTNANTDNVSN